MSGFYTYHKKVFFYFTSTQHIKLSYLHIWYSTISQLPSWKFTVISINIFLNFPAAMSDFFSIYINPYECWHIILILHIWHSNDELHRCMKESIITTNTFIVRNDFGWTHYHFHNKFPKSLEKIWFYSNIINCLIYLSLIPGLR